MPKQPRKQAKAKSKPLTANPLFPAVVALWFGALFGLGSLAVRPSLLESLVIASRLDLVVPAAAPPLGVTARALVALILAAIGAAIGTIIARRLARPKPDKRERQRSNLKADAAYSAERGFGMAERTPAYSDNGGGIAARRRALTAEHDNDPYVPGDIAPLPGGSAPQVLDIAAMGFAVEPAEMPDAPLDLGAFDRSILNAPEVPAFEPPTADISALRNQAPSPAPEPLVAESLADDRSEFVAAESYAMREVDAAAADGRQVFGLSQAETTEPVTRQIFGQAIEDDHVSADFVKAAGFTTTVFDTPEPSPLFARRVDAEGPVEAAVQKPEAVFESPVVPAFGDFAEDSAVNEPAFSSAMASSADDSVAAQDQEPALAETETADTREILPPPSSLGMTDLAARLAESMARRRAARSGVAHVPAAVESPDVHDEASVETAAPSVQVDQSAAAEVTSLPQLPPILAAASAAAEPIAAQEFAHAADPVAAQDLQPAASEAAASPVTVLPAALRPIEFADFDEPEGDVLDDLLPPRRMGFEPAPQPQPEPQSQNDSAAFEPAAVEDSESEEADVTDEGGNHYGSLLGIKSAARSGFVRIDEPAELAEAIEPVVIFPGQMARPVLVEEPASFRQFDSPDAAGQGQAIAVSDAAPAVDREEADKALRMALANLQRMSGAA